MSCYVSNFKQKWNFPKTLVKIFHAMQSKQINNINIKNKGASFGPDPRFVIWTDFTSTQGILVYFTKHA